jgi:superfamily II DNA or RNA helicase
MYKKYKDYYIIPVYLGLQLLNKSLKDCVIKFPDKKELYNNIQMDNIILRQHQIAPYEKVLEEFTKPLGGGILNLSTAFGKTVLGLKIITHSKLKTLVIVNKIELMEQWRKAINDFVPEAKIGKIQGPVFDIEGKDIVIGMLQTLAKKYNANDFKYFGLCIIDECHNIPSQIFSNIAFKIRPRYLLGLSATVERKDDMHHIIYGYIGDILYSNINKADKQHTLIKMIKYKGSSSIEKFLYNGNPAISTMITDISKDIGRNDLILQEIYQLLNENNDRNILVISDRTAQLKYFYKKLGSEISGLFIGSLSGDEREESKNKRVLLGTYGLTNEGFNLPKLNSIVFATPRSNIVQAIGRIYRKTHDIQPIIVDIYDTFSLFKYQGIKRRKTYTEVIKNCVFYNEKPPSKSLDEGVLFLD